MWRTNQVYRLQHLSYAQYLVYVLIWFRCSKYLKSQICYLEACHRPPVSHWKWRLRCRCQDTPQSWARRRLGECPGGGTRSWTQRCRWEQLPAPRGCGRRPQAAASLRFQYAWRWWDLQQKYEDQPETGKKESFHFNLSKLLHAVWLTKAAE